MKKIILLILILPVMIFSQDLTVSISAEKDTYDKIYGRNNENDLIALTYTVHNNTGSPVKVKFEPYFSLVFAEAENFGYDHCFRMYEKIKTENDWNRNFKYDEYSSFVDIPANDSLTRTGNFIISWLCRGAPPFGDWSFNIKYERELTEEDNFYLAGSRYTDFTSKEYIKAWTGKLVSNNINIKILREKN